MGRVFSWNEIVKGHIPQFDDFGAVVEEIHKQVNACDAVIGGVICGSVNHNTHTNRSDVDFVSLYEARFRHFAFEAFQKISQFAFERNIIASIYPLDIDTAGTAYHHIDFFYFQHLERAIKNGGQVKADILPFISPNEEQALLQVKVYFRRKLMKFEHILCEIHVLNHAQLHTYLAKTLEIAVHGARKMLLYHGMLLPDADTKNVIQSMYALIASQYEYWLFNKLIQLDAEYSRELERQLSNPDKRSYERMLRKIQAALPTAIEFVRLCIFRLQQQTTT